MSNDPKISIVLPTYNQARYLPGALEGILQQTFQDFELIVVNDGSKDPTPQVLAEYQKRIEFQVVEQENQGLPRALNAGFALANGDYFTWTSSDNIMLPGMLKSLSIALDDDQSVGVVYSDWYFIDDAGQVISLYKTLDYDRHLLLRQNYVHCSFLFRRECMEKVGRYDPAFIYGEDWEFWIRVSQDFKMKHVPEALYQYRVHTQSMTTELKQGTARREINDLEFKKYLKRQMPFGWYYSKLKWELLKLRLGYDPGQQWDQAINLPDEI